MINLAGISKEVKEEIVSKIKGGARVVDVSKDYGVSTKTIYYWLRGKADAGASGMEVSRLRKENEELKAIIGALAISKPNQRLLRRQIRGGLCWRFH